MSALLLCGDSLAQASCKGMHQQPMRSMNITTLKTFKATIHGNLSGWRNHAHGNWRAVAEKTIRMRWEYHAPREKLFLIDSQTAYFYVTGDRQAQKTPARTWMTSVRRCATFWARPSWKKSWTACLWPQTLVPCRRGRGHTGCSQNYEGPHFRSGTRGVSRPPDPSDRYPRGGQHDHGLPLLSNRGKCACPGQPFPLHPPREWIPLRTVR